MRILLDARVLRDPYNGVSTWVKTISKALTSLGHEIVSDRPDVIIGAHTDVIPRLKKYDVPIINVIHGVLPPQERPVPGCAAYIAVSEEVAKHCRPYETRIIRQPIDQEIFTPVGCGASCKTIAILGRRRIFPWLKELQAEYNVITLPKGLILDIANLIRPADLVVATGRGVYEAMSMGKNVIVSGNNSGMSKFEVMDGYLDYYKYRTYNMSGRYNNIRVRTYKQFRLEIDKYTQECGDRDTLIIQKHHNPQIIAQEILCSLQ